MLRIVKVALVTLVGAALLAPAMALAKPGDGKRSPRIVVFAKPTPKYRGGPYGFLPGYRQPPALGEWRDRSPRHGGGDFSRDRRYISGWEWRYGWGYPRFYRGQWTDVRVARCARRQDAWRH
jgi:hypothetical protein